MGRCPPYYFDHRHVCTKTYTVRQGDMANSLKVSPADVHRPTAMSGFRLGEIARWYVVLPLTAALRQRTFPTEAPWTIENERRTGSVLAAWIAA
jgi:hypothetical protein